VAGISYGYDADNRRTSQSIGGATTRYLWDGLSHFGDVVLESDQNRCGLKWQVLDLLRSA
jgi:hypothetical protein